MNNPPPTKSAAGLTAPAPSRRWGLSLAIIICGALAPNLSAVPEANLPKDYQTVIEPYYYRGRAGVFTGVKGPAIQYRVFPAANSQGALVILPGRAEASLKYAELIYDLRDSGFSLYVINHRGQGSSQRLLADPQKGYVDQWQDYVDDLTIFFDRVVNATAHRRRIILGHSMGGAIAAAFLEQRPNYADKLILSSPMFGIKAGGLPEWLLLAGMNILTWLGRGQDYAPGQKSTAIKPFDSNPQTTSQIRYQVLYVNQSQTHPNIVLGGPTNRWVQQAILLSRYARDHLSQIRLPVLVLHDQNDRLVNVRQIHNFARQVPNVRQIVYHQAKHEVLMETDQIRTDALKQIRAFLGQ